jgi:hypothetical protein
MSKYVVVSLTAAASIDFDDLKDNSLSTVRENIAGTECVLEYEGTMPSAISNLDPVPTEMTHTQAKTLRATSAWYVADELDNL